VVSVDVGRANSGRLLLTGGRHPDDTGVAGGQGDRRQHAGALIGIEDPRHRGDRAARLVGEQTPCDVEEQALRGRPRVRLSGPPSGDVAARLCKLDELRESGLLTDAEFQATKAEILRGL
jgi:hypothetical protein